MIRDIDWMLWEKLNKRNKNKVEGRIYKYGKKEKKDKVISWIVDKRLKKIL